ncbi:MAG: flagellar basal body L-ring protein FlgH [Terriglobales bacterium]
MKHTTMLGASRWTLVLWTAASLLATAPPGQADTKVKADSQKLRSDYVARMQQQMPATRDVGTLGSLYLPNGAFTDMVADYKARRVNDVVTLVVFENTTAQSTGDVTTSRATTTAAAITALPGKLKTSGVSPLFGSNSSNQLAGKGETSAGSNVTTTLSARVIALLPNGDMVVEAERRVDINSQHETMVVRGVLRPGDVGPNNTAPSTALANLEIELKGKGVVSDSIKRPNPIIRTLFWLIGF